MFYRRKIILVLIQLFDWKVDKIRLQKLLFLFTQRQIKAEYDFIPYRFGCYSFSANADLLTMVKKGMLTENENHFVYNEPKDYFNDLKETDKKIMLEIKSLYNKMNAAALMKHTYLNFPYWATNSIKASEILSLGQLQKVEESKPKISETILFTIGYEGISLEGYLNKLIINDIKILVDVRNNPLSMKYGFSKSQLIRFCNSVGIDYLHFPEVGIQSVLRQELNNQNDYDQLFEDYCESNLKKTTNSQLKILDLLINNKRIALTCFEANICQCHRKHLAEAIENLSNYKYQVKHI